MAGPTPSKVGLHHHLRDHPETPSGTCLRCRWTPVAGDYADQCLGDDNFRARAWASLADLLAPLALLGDATARHEMLG